MCGHLSHAVPPPPGAWPATQACALSGNRTSDPLIRRLVLNPLSHTSLGNWCPGRKWGVWTQTHGPGMMAFEDRGRAWGDAFFWEPMKAMGGEAGEQVPS